MTTPNETPACPVCGGVRGPSGVCTSCGCSTPPKRCPNCGSLDLDERGECFTCPITLPE